MDYEEYEIMSENELLIERDTLLGRLVEINWYYMATKKRTTSLKRKNFLAVLQEEIMQEEDGSNIIFVEEDGDVYICMIFRTKSIVKKVVIDILDPNRKKSYKAKFARWKRLHLWSFGNYISTICKQ
ncbi:MAG: hypothetical protein ACJZ8S_01445 [Paracoccaceae bacterium]